jgi:DNA-binding MurR/RpiR family transcriptional regulator
MIRHKKYLTEREFKLAKTLLEADIPMRKIAIAMDRSLATISRLAKTVDWEEYQVKKAAYAQKQTAERHNGHSVNVQKTNQDKILTELVKIKEGVANLEDWLRLVA